MKKDEKLILWTERLQAFQASGQTCREWCREHQIPVSTMTYWNRRLRTLESESQPELVFAKMPTAGTFHKRSHNRKYTSAYLYYRQYPD